MRRDNIWTLPRTSFLHCPGCSYTEHENIENSEHAEQVSIKNRCPLKTLFISSYIINLLIIISACGSMSRCRGQRRAGEQADISTFTAQLSDSVFITCSSAASSATSAANQLIGEVVQSRRRPLLGPRA